MTGSLSEYGGSVDRFLGGSNIANNMALAIRHIQLPRKQAQIDWKENFEIVLNNGEIKSILQFFSQFYYIKYDNRIITQEIINLY